MAPPSVPNLVITPTARVTPAPTFRFEVSGTAVPRGNAVTKPGTEAVTAVRVPTTAVASDGTSPFKLTREIDPTAGGADDRVSSARTADSKATRRPEATGADVGRYTPIRSTIRSQSTYDVRSTAPPPSLIVTRFATAPSKAPRLRLDVSGIGSPAGNTVTKFQPAPRLTAVTLSAAATASAGTPGWSVIPTRIHFAPSRW
jgi:hypothetical protein